MNVEPRWKQGRKKPRRSHRARMDALRPVVFARALYRCEIGAPGCTGEVHQAHHVVRRSQGGPDTLENLIATCLSCHSYLHANVLWARERGFLKSRGEVSCQNCGAPISPGADCCPKCGEWQG